MLDKTELLQTIVAELKDARDKAALAADVAKATATSKENVAENKYDTLGLEAAYLAHGQSGRILQLEEDIRAYEQMEIKESNQVALGSLVQLEHDKGEMTVVFLGPACGGFKINYDNQSVQIVTPAAPLGRLLLGAQPEDEITLQTGSEDRVYLVAAVS